MKFRYCCFVWILLFALTAASRAQVVGVTLQLDTNTITVGQGTTLHVFAQVLPAFRATSDRIFSWYVDVVNTNGAAASAGYAAMLKPASDKDPLISSNGFTSGADRLAIYDTFLNLPRAGVTNPVELLRIPITGLAAGQTRFSVRHGTGQPNLAQDFLVAPTNGSSFLSGGDYTTALANLTVLPASGGATNVPCLTIAQASLGGSLQRITLNYCPLAGYDHFVEFQNAMQGGAGWQSIAGGPFNSGLYIETNNIGMRYYRIRAQIH